MCHYIIFNKLTDDPNCALSDTDDIVCGGQVSIHIYPFNSIQETIQKNKHCEGSCELLRQDT